MELPPRLATALQALTDAVDRLEEAADRRRENDRARGDIAGELVVMQEDRMRLAGDLGRTQARNQALQDATSEVGARLDRVTATLRALAAVQAKPVEVEAASPNETDAFLRIIHG